MGGGSSKANAVTPEPIFTTVPVHTTVYTSTAALKASEVKCWIDDREILYVSLAFLSGLLSTLLVFAVICLCRKKYKRSHQDFQEQVPSQAATEESAMNSQNEVAYSSVVFQRNRTPMAV
ncbi:transmembrane protein C1orf162 homolog [Leptosomus discolor]